VLVLDLLGFCAEKRAGLPGNYFVPLCDGENSRGRRRARERETSQLRNLALGNFATVGSHRCRGRKTSPGKHNGQKTDGGEFDLPLRRRLLRHDGKRMTNALGDIKLSTHRRGRPDWLLLPLSMPPAVGQAPQFRSGSVPVVKSCSRLGECRRHRHGSACLATWTDRTAPWAGNGAAGEAGVSLLRAL
jgi:hypothetical protein